LSRQKKIPTGGYVNTHITSPSPTTPHFAPDAKERLTYSVEEAATILGLSKPTIYRLLVRNILRALPGLRTKRITHLSVEKYIASANGR
jgi:excisionase family DNA binding protein